MEMQRIKKNRKKTFVLTIELVLREYRSQLVYV